MAKSTKVVSIMLVLLIAVQARDSYTFDDYSELSDSDQFLQDSEANSDSPFQPEHFSFQTQSHNPQVSEETNFPSETQFPNPQVSDETNMAFETQSPPSDITDDSDTDSVEDSNLPLVTQDFPLGADLNFEIDSARVLRKSPPPTSSPAIAKECTCLGKCANKCKRKETGVLRKICSKHCNKRCYHDYMEEVYVCTEKCGDAMPKKFNSDLKKAVAYMDYCYNKCLKKL